MATLMLCYYSIVPCAWKGNISATVICHLQIILINTQVGLNKLSLTALVAYPMALRSALLYRECSQ